MVRIHLRPHVIHSFIFFSRFPSGAAFFYNSTFASLKLKVNKVIEVNKVKNLTETNEALKIERNLNSNVTIRPLSATNIVNTEKKDDNANIDKIVSYYKGFLDEDAYAIRRCNRRHTRIQKV